MQFPMIHLNGSSKNALVEGYSEALDAVRNAIEKLAMANPNGRDYYPLGPDAASKAAAEQRERFAALEKVRGELEALLENVVDQ